MLKIFLKKIKIVDSMSEETICFTADVHDEATGKRICSAKNDGWGGSTHLYNYDTPSEFHALWKKLQSEGFDLEAVVDEALYAEFNRKEKAKVQKKMMRHMEKGICFGVPEGEAYHFRGFTRPLADIFKTPNGSTHIQKLVQEVKAELAPNEVIFNTNLSSFGINLA